MQFLAKRKREKERERERESASHGKNSRLAGPTSPRVDVARIYAPRMLYLEKKSYFCVELNHPFLQSAECDPGRNRDGIWPAFT
jgi:hypothetical protein